LHCIVVHIVIKKKDLTWDEKALYDFSWFALPGFAIRDYFTSYGRELV